MSLEKPVILIVDDEPINVDILLEYLEDTRYELDTAEDGQQAWEMLQARPERYDVILLDRMMPNMDGLAVLEHVKQHPALQSVPVVLQTGMAAHEEIVEGLQAGAYYYLTKPFQEDMLLGVVHTAVGDRLRYLRAQNESDVVGRSFGLLREAEFRFRTIEESRDLSSVLANACPDPRKVIVGLTELLLNAVEHGNLDISYKEKGELREQGRWDEEVERRLSLDENRDKVVIVKYLRGEGSISITITDQGKGFAWQDYVDMDPSRIFDNHGRGIAMSRMVSFDELQYLGCGNEVEAIIHLD